MALVNNLRTLDAFVYEVQMDVDLETFEKMTTLDQMKYLLSNTEDLAQSIRSLLVPFLYRMDDLKAGTFYSLLHQFCMHVSAQDLQIALTMVENSRPGIPGAILTDAAQIIRLAIDACYAHELGSQIDFMDRICKAIGPYFEIVPGRWNMEFVQQYNLNLDEYRNFIQHLEIAKILARHGQTKGLLLFREKNRNLDAMLKIFGAVTSHAESVKPRIDQDGWRSVLRDLQKLQKLISVVPIPRVYYMFCESLLSSGSLENIDLAGDVLKTMLEPEDQVPLILTAWTHYFSTSSNLHDPNIELAKHCLCLIKSNSKEILDCGDLISSLQSLADFGLSDVHPVTVLNSKNRLEFVIKALDAKPQAYKNSQRLMKLATLLKAESIDNVLGVVWSLIAKKALNVGDIQACQTACNNIIQHGYTAGWDICFALGLHADLTDLHKGMDLLAFAATHCDEENIENVTFSLLKVEQKLLHASLSTKANVVDTDDVFIDVMEEVPEQEEEENFEDSYEEITASAKKRDISPFAAVLGVKNSIMSVTSLSSQYLLDNDVSKSILRHTSSWFKTISINESLQTTVNEDEDNSFTALHFPAFYSSLFDEGVKLSGPDVYRDGNL